MESFSRSFRILSETVPAWAYGDMSMAMGCPGHFDMALSLFLPWPGIVSFISVQIGGVFPGKVSNPPFLIFVHTPGENIVH